MGTPDDRKISAPYSGGPAMLKEVECLGTKPHMQKKSFKNLHPGNFGKHKIHCDKYIDKSIVSRINKGEHVT